MHIIAGLDLHTKIDFATTRPASSVAHARLPLALIK